MNQEGKQFADLTTIGPCALGDDAEYEAIRARVKAKRAESRAIKTQLRRQARRANSEAELAVLLPPYIDAGSAWHVLSGGNIDSLSFLSHALRSMNADYTLISTWCMAIDDVAAVKAWIESGVIAHCDAYVGEIFPVQYPGAHDALCNVLREIGGRVAVFRNHSKVMIAGNWARNDFIVIESSANVNTNPRTEQTVIANDRGLFDHYKSFYDGIHSYNRNFDGWKPWEETANRQR